ncbi:O-antigen ligase family protein [Pseudarthrobacter sp. lyk4-40-TYG-27]|uniref:O-antigen ligase family protein n=1 Tax=Pseudarthrobacter sp. lyk4-40-TYG-27 TaxID=3040305 RepID=UPI002554C549|nr:O-antigen ligase family protein [Pseudarthrobacter sp. lyk4-40-TYG-27]
MNLMFWFLLIAMVLGVLQLYVLPFLPLSIWWILIMSPFVLLSKKIIALPKFTIAIGAIVLIQAFSAAWSPDPLQAIRSAGTTFTLLVVLVASTDVLTFAPNRFRKVLDISGLFVSFHAVLIATFFLFPKIESTYLRSSIARYFSGEGVTRIYSDLFNNVVLDGKAGGFFVNGNTASMFMGVCSALFMASFFKFKSKAYLLVAVMAYAGALLTGSKTALFIGVAWVGACVLLYAAAKKAHLFLPGIMVAVLGLQAGLAYILDKVPEFAMDSSHTFGSRQLMWNVAIDGLSESPFLGLGYGGWFSQYEKFGSEIGFSVRPAHNLILQTWLDTGIPGVAALLLFFGAIFAVCITLSRSGRDRYSAVACCLLAMAGWIFIHGQGDNTALYGDTHSLVFFGVGLALLGYSQQSNDAEGDSGLTSDFGRSVNREVHSIGRSSRRHPRPGYTAQRTKPDVHARHLSSGM